MFQIIQKRAPRFLQLGSITDCKLDIGKRKEPSEKEIAFTLEQDIDKAAAWHILVRSQAHNEADSKTKYGAPKLVLQEKVPGWREAGHLGRWVTFSRSSIQSGLRRSTPLEPLSANSKKSLITRRSVTCLDVKYMYVASAWRSTSTLSRHDSRDWSLAPRSAATQKICFWIKEASPLQACSYFGNAGVLRLSKAAIPDQRRSRRPQVSH